MKNSLGQEVCIVCARALNIPNARCQISNPGLGNLESGIVNMENTPAREPWAEFCPYCKAEIAAGASVGRVDR